MYIKRCWLLLPFFICHIKSVWLQVFRQKNQPENEMPRSTSSKRNLIQNRYNISCSLKDFLPSAAWSRCIFSGKKLFRLMIARISYGIRLPISSAIILQRFYCYYLFRSLIIPNFNAQQISSSNFIQKMLFVVRLESHNPWNTFGEIFWLGWLGLVMFVCVLWSYYKILFRGFSMKIYFVKNPSHESS